MPEDNPDTDWLTAHENCVAVRKLRQKKDIDSKISIDHHQPGQPIKKYEVRVLRTRERKGEIMESSWDYAPQQRLSS